MGPPLATPGLLGVLRGLSTLNIGHPQVLVKAAEALSSEEQNKAKGGLG